MALDGDIRILSACGSSRASPHEQLRLIAFGAESRSLPEEAALSRGGQRRFRLCHRRRHAARRAQGEGERERSSATRSRAPILGERALIVDTRATIDQRGGARHAVLQIRKAMFRRLLQEYPEIADGAPDRGSSRHLQAFRRIEQVGERLGVSACPCPASDGADAAALIEIERRRSPARGPTGASPAAGVAHSTIDAGVAARGRASTQMWSRRRPRSEASQSAAR